MKKRNKITIYCNFETSPIENSFVNTSHVPHSFITKIKKEIRSYLDLKLDTITNTRVYRMYLYMCADPVMDIEKDEDGYVLFYWNIDNICHTPKNKKQLIKLIYDAIDTGVDGKHVVLNSNSAITINMLRWYVFKGKLKDTDVKIITLDGSKQKTVTINENGKYTNSKKKVIEFPSEFFGVELDELLEMM